MPSGGWGWSALSVFLPFLFLSTFNSTPDPVLAPQVTCPVTGWTDCEDGEDDKWLIAEALNAYYANPYNDDRCERAWNAIVFRLQGTVHVFGSNDGDDGGNIVVGEVIGGGQYLGFRRSLLDGFFGDTGIFLTAIHEGAHLAGMGEGDAEEVEMRCQPLH